MEEDGEGGEARGVGGGAGAVEGVGEDEGEEEVGRALASSGEGLQHFMDISVATD